MFGGSVNPGHEVNKDFVWRIHGARARGFLQTIYGLLSPRRKEQILMVIKPFWDAHEKERQK